MIRSSTTAAAIAACIIGSAQAGPVRRQLSSPWGASGPAPAGYSVFPDQQTFADATISCQNIGGRLAEIFSRESNEYLYQLAMDEGVDSGFWIGAQRTDPDSNDDSAFTWSAAVEQFGQGLPNVDADGNHDLWVRNEPNNYRGKEFCVRAGNTDGRWNDAKCSQRNAYACWVEPTTTTTTDITTTTTDVTTTTTDVTSTTTDVTSTTTDATTSTTEAASTTTTDVTTTTTDVTSTTTDVTSTTTDVTSTTTDATTTTTEAASTTTTEVTTTTPQPTTLLEPLDAEGWSYYEDTKCWYQQFGSNGDKKNMADASADCAAQTFNDGQAWLTTPMSIDEAMFVGSLGEAGRPAWIGAKRLANDNTFMYHDKSGDEIVADNWYAGEPNSAIADESCVQRGLGRRGADNTPWKFNDVPCSASNYWTCQYCHTIVTTTAEPTTTTTDVTTTTTDVTTTTTAAVTTTTEAATTMDVPSWDSFPETGCYYKQSESKMNQADAKAQCGVGGAMYHKEAGEESHLAFPKSEAEAQFMAAFQTRAGNPSWVGVERLGSTNRFVTSIDTAFVTDLFYPGEGMDATEQCVQMGYSHRKSDTSPWLLNDANCGNANYAICRWCPPVAPTTTTTEVTSTTTDVTSTTTDATSTTTDVTSTTTDVTTTSTPGSSTTTTSPEPRGDTGNFNDGTKSPATSEPTPAPTTSEPSPLPTPAPSTSEPSPLPTSAPSTSEPSPSPTTAEPTPPPTCTTVPTGSENFQEAIDAVSEHQAYIGSVLANVHTKKSGRAEPYKTTCDDFCAQRSFGAGCQPCGLETITSEAECMFPGPFATGVLCHKDPQTQLLTNTKCCMRKNMELDYAVGNEFTTCRLPKRECECDAGFDYDQAFAASFHMAPLSRTWTGTQCVAL